MAVRITGSCQGFQFASVSPQLLQERQINIHRAVVIDQNSDFQPFTDQVSCIVQKKCCFPRSQKSCYQVYFNHYGNYLFMIRHY